MKKSLYLSVSLFGLGLTLSPDASASWIADKMAADAARAARQQALVNAPNAAEVERLRLELAQRRDAEIALTQQLNDAQNAVAENNLPAQIFEVNHFGGQRIEVNHFGGPRAAAAAPAVAGDAALEIALLRKQLADQMLELNRLRNAGPQADEQLVAAGEASQEFIDRYAGLTPAERLTCFEAAFKDMYDNRDQQSVSAVLMFTTQRMQAISTEAGNNPTQEQMDEYKALQTMQSRICTSPGLAPGRENFLKKLSVIELQKERAEDAISHAKVMAELDSQLDVATIDLKEENLRLDFGVQAHRKIPILLYLLKINHRVLLSVNGFEMVQWAQWSDFIIKNMGVDQRRAIRFHMKQGNYPSTIKAPENVKQTIINFLDTLSAKIRENTPAKTVTRGDIDCYNSNLGSKLQEHLNKAAN